MPTHPCPRQQLLLLCGFWKPEFGRLGCPLVPMKSWEEAWWALNMGLLSWPGREAQLPLRALSGLILMAPVRPVMAQRDEELEFKPRWSLLKLYDPSPLPLSHPGVQSHLEPKRSMICLFPWEFPDLHSTFDEKPKE